MTIPSNQAEPRPAPATRKPTLRESTSPGRDGFFGRFGGCFVPETVIPALEELEQLRGTVLRTKEFRARYEDLLSSWAGRPTPLYEAHRLAEAWGGRCRVLLKREDLNHTGAHKILNALGQGLLAQTAGKRRIVCETGAGQHGVAVASVCALLDLKCHVYMGAVDMDRQAPNVARMRLLGAHVEPVHAGSRTLKDATSAAIRDWVTNVRTTHYLIGSVVGPHPYPLLVRSFASRIGQEARRQMLRIAGRLPDAVVACVGGGSNAMGIMHAFLPDAAVALHGVEAGGRDAGLGQHAASLLAGAPGVLHGAYSCLLQDVEGQVADTHSISAGLDYPGVGPELAALRDAGRLQVAAVGDDEALESFHECTRLAGILPALESAHALAFARRLVRTLPEDSLVLVNLSGRGDKDLATVADQPPRRSPRRGALRVPAFMPGVPCHPERSEGSPVPSRDREGARCSCHPERSEGPPVPSRDRKEAGIGGRDRGNKGSREQGTKRRRNEGSEGEWGWDRDATESLGENDSSPPARVEAALRRRMDAGGKALVPFFSAGFPTVRTFIELLRAAQAVGCDAIEVGVPFSDPIADGPSIQFASGQALQRGVTLQRALDAISKAQLDTPVILMSYLNPLLAYGLERLAGDARAAGVGGLLVPDLPLVKDRPPRRRDGDNGRPTDASVSGDTLAAARTLLARDLEVILLAAPTTRAPRLRLIGRATRGFLYAVTVTGVTGARDRLPPETSEFLERARKATPRPVLAGFGVANKETARSLAGHCDGVIVGSAIVELLRADGKRSGVRRVTRFLEQMRAALDAAARS